MWAVLSAICFALAFLFHGGAIAVNSHWFDPTGLLYLGATFLAIHVIPGLQVWPLHIRRRP